MSFLLYEGHCSCLSLTINLIVEHRNNSNIKELMRDENTFLFVLSFEITKQKCEKLKPKIWVSSFTYNITFTSNLDNFAVAGHKPSELVHNFAQKKNNGRAVNRTLLFGLSALGI